MFPHFKALFAPTVAALIAFSAATPASAGTLSQSCLAVDRVAKPQVTVYFAVDSVAISAQDRALLTKAAYDGQSQGRVCVIGQADKQGNTAHNMALAARRANAVADILRSNGLNSGLLEAGARGEAFNDSVLEILGSQKQDRRVDVYFITNAER